MGELLNNARNGWLAYMGAGKLVALLILVLLLCSFFKLADGRKKELFRYGAVMAAICIFPYSAVLFMIYQTRFYDYEWIWALVPLTAVIACGEVLLFGAWKKWRGGKKDLLLFFAVLLMFQLFCSSLGNPDWQVENLEGSRQEVSGTLEKVRQGVNGDILMWAPKEVILQVRGIGGDIRLLYGRDMFQEHLNAYSYDVYPAEYRELYVWMVMAGRYGTIDVPVEGDVASGKDDLLIGDRIDGMQCMKEDSLQELTDAYGLTCTPLTDYYLLTIEERSYDR